MPSPAPSKRTAKQTPSRGKGSVGDRAFEFTIHAETGKPFVRFLRRHLPAAHALIPKTKLADLSLALVGDRRMSDLHVQFMNIPGPTDVLTFPLDADERGRPTSGEVVVCVPEARRRAREHSVPVERELLLYALHGLLHLSGFDDRTDPDYQRMHRTEDRILTRLGIGPTFQPDRPPAKPRKPPARPRKIATTSTRRRATQ